MNIYKIYCPKFINFKNPMGRRAKVLKKIDKFDRGNFIVKICTQEYSPIINGSEK